MAKDLGVHHYGYQDKRPEMEATLQCLLTASKRIKLVGGP